MSEEAATAGAEKPKKGRAARKPRSTQPDLPGVERQRFKDVEEAAEDYQEAKEALGQAGEDLAESKKTLRAVMRKHDLTIYRDDNVSPPLVVTRNPGEDE